MRVDLIHWLSTPLIKNNLTLDPEDWDEMLRAARKPYIDFLWDELLRGIGEQTIESELFLRDLEHDFALTISSGTPLEELTSDWKEKHQAAFEMYRQLARRAAVQGRIQQSDYTELAEENYRGNSDLFQQYVDDCQGYRLAYTWSGRLALVPALTELNDICFIFLGLSVPFVLRPTANDRFNLVGGCYLHGIMAGELMESKGHTLKEEIVIIE